jgi:ParB-like chromosome segregation protein Spo0J
MALVEALSEPREIRDDRPAAARRRGEAANSSVAIRELRTGYSPRQGALNEDHIARLAATPEAWPPLVVQRSTMRVVDGNHRLAAARRLGLVALPVAFLNAGDDDAVLEAIRLNTHHGLPLTLTERREAARELLRLHPFWSDRSIAKAAGLSAGTVTQLRSATLLEGSAAKGGEKTRDGVKPARRTGLDGRSRPVDPVFIRSLVAREVEADWSASLRTIAARTGVSPETVRAVRRTLMSTGGEHEPCLRPSAAEAHPPSAPLPPLRNDPAFLSTPEGKQFLKWFFSRDIDLAEARKLADTVPLGRVYDVIDEAQTRAAAWNSFACYLRERIPRS